MNIVAKLTDGTFVEIAVRELTEAEAEAAEGEVVSIAPEESEPARQGGRRRLLALGLLAVGAVAVSRRLRRGSDDGEAVAVDDESIEIES
jgi:hypothetical protein